MGAGLRAHQRAAAAQLVPPAAQARAERRLQRARLPLAAERLALQVVRVVQVLRPMQERAALQVPAWALLA